MTVNSSVNPEVLHCWISSEIVALEKSDFLYCGLRIQIVYSDGKLFRTFSDINSLLQHVCQRFITTGLRERGTAGLQFLN